MSCGIWNNSNYVSKQFERVGFAYSTSLVHAGYNSFRKLREANPRDLELVVNKQPPFGNHLRNSAAAMPEYDLVLEQVEQGSHNNCRKKTNLKVTVTLKNHDVIAERSTAGRYHTCVLLVCGIRNRTELKVKVKDSLLLSHGSFERVVGIETSPGLHSIPVRAAWISETVSGVDVLKNFKLDLHGRGGRSESLSNKTMAEFFNEDGYDDSDKENNVPQTTTTNSKDYGQSAKRGGGGHPSELRLSPACLKELQHDWSPVSQYFSKETRVITKTTMMTTTTMAMEKRVGSSSSATTPRPLSVASKVRQDTYQIEYLAKAPAKSKISTKTIGQAPSRSTTPALEYEAGESDADAEESLPSLPSPILPQPPMEPRPQTGYQETSSEMNPSQTPWRIGGTPYGQSQVIRSGGSYRANNRNLQSPPPFFATTPESRFSNPRTPSFDQDAMMQRQGNFRHQQQETNPVAVSSPFAASSSRVTPPPLPSPKVFDFSEERLAMFNNTDRVSKIEVQKPNSAAKPGEEKSILSAALKQFLADHERKRKRREEGRTEAEELLGVRPPREHYPFRMSAPPSASTSSQSPSVASQFAVRKKTNPFRNSKLREFWAED